MSLVQFLKVLQIAAPLLEEIARWLRTGKVEPLPATLESRVAHNARMVGLQ